MVGFGVPAWASFLRLKVEREHFTILEHPGKASVKMAS